MVDAPPDGRRPWRGRLAGLVVGLVVGAASVGLAWLATSGDTAGPVSGTGRVVETGPVGGADPSGPADAGPSEALADARAACAALRRVGTVDINLDRSQVGRVRAARELSAGAAETDPRYGELADRTEAVLVDLETIDIDAAQASLPLAIASCTSIG